MRQRKSQIHAHLLISWDNHYNGEGKIIDLVTTKQFQHATTNPARWAKAYILQSYILEHPNGYSNQVQGWSIDDVRVISPEDYGEIKLTTGH
jgi:hypothetical protein